MSDREQWLKSLKQDDAVMEIKTTVTMKTLYVEALNDDGSMLVGERTYEADGTSGKGLFTSYRIEPVTKENSEQFAHRQAANYMGGIKWSLYDRATLEQFISVVKNANLKRAA